MEIIINIKFVVNKENNKIIIIENFIKKKYKIIYLNFIFSIYYFLYLLKFKTKKK